MTSSVLLMGPQTYDSIGNETYLTTNRIPKAAGNEHLVDSNISDDGTTIGLISRALSGSSATFSSTIQATQYTATSTAGSGLRVYGASGTNQWDVYLNSTNLRFSDNTGTGLIVFDRPLTGTSATFSNSIDVTTSGSFGFQDYRTQATQKVLVLRGEGVSGQYAPSLFNIYTKPGTTSNGIASIIIKSKYSTDSESGNLFEFKGDGSAIFSSGVQATTLALGSVTPSTNGIYLNNANANGANYGYVKTNALTVNTTQLILGSTYGYNTPVDALTIFNGSTTFANSITTPSLYGSSYAQTSTSGTTSFVNTGIFYNTSITGFSNNSIYNLVISGNPNGAGSSEYRSVYLGYITITTGYDFGISSVVQRISYTQVVTGDAYNIGALTISVVFWNGTTETTQQINGTTNNQIRVKITGYNSGNIGAAQTVLITKVN